MNKKGFTLTELIGVITILGLIAIIAFPPLLKQIKGTKGKIDEATKQLIIAGASNYVDENKNDFPKSEGSIYCVTLQTLVDDNKVSKDLVDSEGNRLNLNKYVNIEIKNKIYFYTIDDICNGKYADLILNGADPVLKEGMIPVTIEANGTVKKANIKEEWYNYTNKKWANAVLVTNSTRNDYKRMKVGNTIEEKDILAYFVWIPRYKYKLWYVEAQDGGNSALDTSKVHSIDIVFENSKTTKSSGTQNGQYLTHPAFTFGDEEINGIWVGKFETGYSVATTTADAEVETADSSKVIIKPNTYSWRYMNVSNMFYTVFGMNDTNNVFGIRSDSDTHMMKNTEWGAATYLSYSKYGKYSEIYLNNNSNHLTGCGADSATSESSLSCLNGYGTKTNNIYNQSTTGNISGIFDMSGGAYEYVMGYTTGANTAYGLSGFTTETFPAPKYVDNYTSTSATQYSNRILGDATGEMGPFADSNDYWYSSWYSDGAAFADSNTPWFYRSGDYRLDYNSGLAYFNRLSGIRTRATSFRVVLV